jgi:hypothetical protein
MQTLRVKVIETMLNCTIPLHLIWLQLCMDNLCWYFGGYLFHPLNYFNIIYTFWCRKDANNIVETSQGL